jgi:N6-L-threonylcarbamoyladenine synthase
MKVLYNNQMNILGIETSCDETAAAVVQDGRRVLSNVVVSQIDIHAAFGGVVPEVAARSHIEVILPVIDKSIQSLSSILHLQSSTSDPWSDIDAIAVANRPGLVGSLLVGTLTARTLAKLKNKPLYPVDHVVSHVYANFLESAEVPPKLLVSPKMSYSVSSSRTVSTSETSGSLPKVSRRDEPVGDSREYTFLADKSLDGLAETSPDSDIKFPILALAISGGHTQLMLFRSHADYEIIGATRDDAVGEAFDKVAKVLGLPYPGGPSIATAAEKGDPNRYKLPKPILKPQAVIASEAKQSSRNSPGSRRLKPRDDVGPGTSFEFSFSGLKTAVLRAVQAEVGVDHTFPSSQLSGLLTASQQADFAASFQRTAVEILLDKLKLADQKYQPKTVCLAGGVASNQLLRQEATKAFPDILLPPPGFSSDNAAMVAARGYFESLNSPPTNPDQVDVKPT